MKKVLIIMLLFLLVGCNKIEDKEEPTVDPKDPEYVVTINLFHWNQCSHCKEEITWLKELDERRDDIKINYYEVNEYPDLVESVREELYVLSEGVPLTVIGTDYILGFGDSSQERRSRLHQHHRYPGARGLHYRSGTFSPRVGRCYPRSHRR